MLCVLVTVLYSAGQFVLMSYLAPYFKQKIGITPGELSLSVHVVRRVRLPRQHPDVAPRRSHRRLARRDGRASLAWP